jgi:hypothetical protein
MPLISYRKEVFEVGGVSEKGWTAMLLSRILISGFCVQYS